MGLLNYENFFGGKRVLVTGHTGFKGSWLSLWLSRLGAYVCGYALPPHTTPSLFHLAKLDEKIESYIGDIRNMNQFHSVCHTFKPEVIFHLAAQPLVRQSYKNPKETFDTNFGGTTNVLESIRQSGSVLAAVFITTDKVYQNREWQWGYRENDNLGGHDPYSASKAASEHAIISYRSSFFSTNNTTGIAAARAGNAIGGGDFSEDRILPDAIRSIQNNSTLIIRNPESIRPWQHVLDPLSAYLLLAQKLAENKKKAAEAWNFGPDASQHFTVRQVIETFFCILGKGNWTSLKAQDAQKQPKEAGVLKLNCDKAYTLLDWQPVYNTGQSIEQTALWYHNVLFEGKDAAQACYDDISDFSKQAASVKSKQVYKKS